LSYLLWGNLWGVDANFSALSRSYANSTASGEGCTYRCETVTVECPMSRVIVKRPPPIHPSVYRRCDVTNVARSPGATSGACERVRAAGPSGSRPMAIRLRDGIRSLCLPAAIFTAPLHSARSKAHPAISDPSPFPIELSNTRIWLPGPAQALPGGRSRLAASPKRRPVSRSKTATSARGGGHAARNTRS